MNRLARLYSILIYIFLYFPIFILIIYSFNSSKYGTSWQGLTLDWYKKLYTNNLLIDSTKNSFLIAGLSASISTFIGTISALALYSYKFKGRKIFSSIVYVLAISPDIIMGISLLILFNLVNMNLGFLSLLLSHITLNLPFVIIIIIARLKTFNKNLINAAKDLGASEWIIFSKIIFPLILPSIISAWLLAFTLSLDDVVISFFVTGPNFEVLPLTLFSMAHLGIKSEINALCTVIFILTLVLIFISHFIFRKKT
jgi:spermidine/putrescine transport system permease protein